MNNKITKGVLLFLAGISLSVGLQGQVTIGSDLPPEQGALLQLKDGDAYSNGETARGALGLPRVSIKSMTIQGASNNLATTIDGTSGSDVWNKDQYIGLMVYNLNATELKNTGDAGDCVRGDANTIAPVYVWTGTEWFPLKPEAYDGAENDDKTAIKEFLAANKMLAENEILDEWWEEEDDPCFAGTKVKRLVKIVLSGKDITSFAGLDKLTSLKEIDLSNNWLTEVKTERLKALEKLNLSGNQIGSIYLMNNTKLTTLNLNTNKLKSINISKNDLLTSFDVSNNNLSQDALDRIRDDVKAQNRCGAYASASFVLIPQNIGGGTSKPTCTP
ncbi:leucine-rich repeat domain-containing protein [Dysgonomonas sp. 511]|uniref:leucine-rich repeat domain-containing protein n=1 Tax=Dysgonomonas sp. 511 TaxID=2302930 RepID=UPI0013D461FB|nr:leucine-rich repeat domain-containing protein [Dysgonomonas sp. 511]NDV79595.1 hypothetical protein [Dysgonomonas sp. 511]